MASEPTTLYLVPHARSAPSKDLPESDWPLSPLAEELAMPITLVDDLRERKLTTLDVGDEWEKALEQCWNAPNQALEGGESNNQCRARVVEAIGGLASAHPGETIAVASHGNAIALFLESLDARFGFEAWRSMRNPELFRVVYRDGHAAWDGERLATRLSQVTS